MKPVAKRTTTLFSLLAILVLLLSACVAPAAPAAPAEGEAPAEPEAAPTEVTVSTDPDVIDWWHISTVEAEAAYWQTLADEFMAANPGTQINVAVLENEAFKQRMASVMQAGDPPDIFQSWGGGVLRAYADAGLLRDISPEFEGEWKDSITAKAALELYGQDGAYYGIPWNWGAVGMWYNKALFAQAGLDPENPPATWTEFVEAVEALKAAGITPITVGERDKWPGHFWWVYFAIREGGEAAFQAAYDRSGSFTDEPFVKAGQDLIDLIAMDPFPEGYLGFTQGNSGAEFGNGRAAMELMGQWHGAVQANESESGEGLGEDLGWFLFPAIEDGAGHPSDVLGGGDGFAVGVNAPDMAIEFLRYLTSPENQVRQVAIFGSPPTTALAEAEVTDPLQAQILEARNNANYLQLYYDQFLPASVGQTVVDAVELIFTGNATAEEAAQMIEEAASFELD